MVMVMAMVSNMYAEGSTKVTTTVIKTVDAMEIIRTSDKAQKMWAEFEKKYTECSKHDMEQKTKIEVARKSLEEKRSAMSKDAQQRQEAEIAKMEREYIANLKEVEELLNSKMQRINQELLADLEKAAAVMAQKNGYDIVQDEVSGKILYSARDCNVTDQIMKEVNSMYAESQKVKQPATTAKA